jgi:hypothetical protein
MGPIGVPELLLLGYFVTYAILAVVIGLGLSGLVSGRRARRLGYASTRAYLRAIPGSDQERRDAADLTLRGLAFCILGLLFSPFVLVGLLPLLYGGRKVLYASMGLGLLDDPEQPGA